MNEVINLGRHRLLCGDATNKEDVETLIGDRTVNLLLTDPPYGIDIVKLNPNGGGSRSQRWSGNHTIPGYSEEAEDQYSDHSGTVGIPARSGFKHTHTHLMME